MKIQLLVDNIDSWILPYAKSICNTLIMKGHECSLIYRHEDVKTGDILFLLGCEKKFNNLHLNKNNLVIHESDLPRGKGWSPLTWQILEGKNTIPVTLSEATNEIDSGVIYSKKYIECNGGELLAELKELQAKTTEQLVIEFVENHPKNLGIVQSGDVTYYSRRLPKDSMLDINKTIFEQFNLLRVCDNKRYPAFFYLNNQKYILKIEKEQK